MSEKVGLVVLAAGKGTRLKVSTPKPLLSISGLTLIDYILRNAQKFAQSKDIDLVTAIVLGHKKESIEKHLNSKYPSHSYYLCHQTDLNGTAGALRVALEKCPELLTLDKLFIICADTPLIGDQEYTALWSAIKQESNLMGVAASFHTLHPTGYGRIKRSKSGFDIIEEKDASGDEKLIKEVNSGFYLLRVDHIKKELSKIGNQNNSKEFYLTDLFKNNFKVQAVEFNSETSFIGINTQEQWHFLKQIILKRKIESLIQEGVIFHQPETCYIEEEVQIEKETIIFPYVNILGNTEIGQNCLIESGVLMRDCHLKDNVQVLAQSYLESSKIESLSVVGPFARIRPETIIDSKVKVGNFVEIKKSHLKEGAKVSHLSYVGDSIIGKNTNVGCGFITCNYDGAQKHATDIGDDVFIGSDVQVIAPIKIGDGSMIAAGSTVNRSVPNNSFAIARGELVIKEGLAHKYKKQKPKG